jgi:hypothetical protein
MRIIPDASAKPFNRRSGRCALYYVPFDRACRIGAVGTAVFELDMASWLSQQLGMNVYPLRIPQKRTSYPYLTYTPVDGDSILKLSGPSRLYFSRIQFDSYSPIYGDSARLDAALESVFADYIGIMGAFHVENITRHPRQAFADTPPVSSDAAMFRTMSEFTFWYYKNPFSLS